jgi:hypothetical protein
MFDHMVHSWRAEGALRPYLPGKDDAREQGTQAILYIVV